MIFNATAIDGVFEILLEPLRDERGFFARSWCAREFDEQGLDACTVQCNVSFNRRRGTLRGIHFQAAPHEESKLIRCTRGRLFDVAVDLRPDSPTFCKWLAFELAPDNMRMIYIPKGVGHGFQTLADDTEIFYQMSTYYYPGAGRGVRWDSARIGIEWPLSDPIMSERDRALPDLDLVIL